MMFGARYTTIFILNHGLIYLLIWCDETETITKSVRRGFFFSSVTCKTLVSMSSMDS